MNPYGPVAIFLAVATAAALLFTTLPGLLARKRPNAHKQEPYECGVEPTSPLTGRFPVRFYLIAMLFVIFDVETMFLFPWAILYRGWIAQHMGAFALVSMFVFLGILLVGYVWLYKKGALDWA